MNNLPDTAAGVLVVVANTVALVAVVHRLAGHRRRRAAAVSGESGLPYRPGRAPVLAGDGAALDLNRLDPTGPVPQAADSAARWPIYRTAGGVR